jgi:hypothetical protein
MKYLVFLLLPLLAACSENYRYPCQDPDNWETKECKKPYCSANGTCPEDLQHYEKEKLGGRSGNSSFSQPVLQQQTKGDCK